MWPWGDHLKLGKTSAFVKRDLRLLPLTHAEFEADFFQSGCRRERHVTHQKSEWGRVIFSLCGAKQEAHVCKRLISIARKIATSLSEALDTDSPPSPNPR